MSKEFYSIELTTSKDSFGVIYCADVVRHEIKNDDWDGQILETIETYQFEYLDDLIDWLKDETDAYLQ